MKADPLSFLAILINQREAYAHVFLYIKNLGEIMRTKIWFLMIMMVLASVFVSCSATLEDSSGTYTAEIDDVEAKLVLTESGKITFSADDFDDIVIRIPKDEVDSTGETFTFEYDDEEGELVVVSSTEIEVTHKSINDGDTVTFEK